MLMENNHLSSPSHLSKVLQSGKFALAAELSPPKGVDRSVIEREANILKDVVDAVNVTDNQAASVRMASIPVCAILKQLGLDPVAQMTCRDRNRLAMQSDLLGASALGIRNLLCLSGDHGRWGDHPHAKGVYDIDSNHLLWMVRNLIENGCLENGKKLSSHPEFFIGAAANPFARPFEYRPYRLAKKVIAGARFVQTQLIYNVQRFKEYMTKVCDLGLDNKVYILAGVGPLKSARQASYMAEKIPGMEVPLDIVTRMEKTPKAAQPEQGIQICCEVIEQVRSIPGVAGLHIMAVNWAESIPEILRISSLKPTDKTAI
jgi:5,10-methylenetetrahydrofolate reductase